MTSKRSNPEYLNGVPELLVLQLLARRPMHGYELVQSLQAARDEALAFGEGCIYPILHRLEADKLLAARTQTEGGRKRTVYHVTAAGRRRLAERVAAWKRITQAVAQTLDAQTLDGGQDAIAQLA